MRVITKRRGHIFLSFQRGIFVVITTIFLCTLFSLHVHVHVSVHHIYTSWTLWCTLTPYTLHLFFYPYFTTPQSACAMLHISFYLSRSGFLTMSRQCEPLLHIIFYYFSILYFHSCTFVLYYIHSTLPTTRSTRNNFLPFAHLVIRIGQHMARLWDSECTAQAS